jgi:IS30 family transposase
MTKGYKHLTQDQKREVLAAYGKTNSAREVARHLGVSYAQVVHVLQMNGIPRAGDRPSACRRSRELVLQMVQEGKSNSEIGRTIGTTHHRVKDFLDRNHIARPKRDNRMENNSHWQGGRMTDKDGYVLIKVPNHPNATRHGYVLEHRLVMEKHLARYLMPKEVVHHIDGDHQNNVLGNLKLYPANNEHLREELTGKVPKWTPDGIARISKALRRPRRHRQRTIHSK